MYKLDLPLDYKEAAAIERRRNQEAQRKSRIFNAKTRIIGIDKQALDEQLQDRKQMELMEKKRDEAFHMDAVRNDHIATLIEKRQDFDKKQLDQAVNDFRDLHQQPCGRREFDLYDPESKKKDRPAREGDDDARCGISSMQKMDGEDLNNKARRKFQNEQNREWYTEQAVEKTQAKNNQLKADRYYDLKSIENDQRAIALEAAEKECARAVKNAHSDYNKALAREMGARNNLKNQQNQDDNATELANNIYGDFLTENPGTAQSSFGPNRVISDRWKGMTPEQLADIRRIQLLQRQENERIRDEDKKRDEEYARQRLSHARAATLMEREADRRQHDIDTHFDAENRRLGSDQTAHQNHLDNDVYTNAPTAGYFMQFNTTTR